MSNNFDDDEPKFQFHKSTEDSIDKENEVIENENNEIQKYNEKIDKENSTPFLKSNKGRIYIGICFVLAVFWTAYAVDMYVNSEPTEIIIYDLTLHCYSEVMKRTDDGSVVYMGFECSQDVTYNEMNLAIDELKNLATEELGFDELPFPYLPQQLYNKFTGKDPPGISGDAGI